MFSGQLSLLPSVGREMSSKVRLRGEGLVWLIGGDGVSASCTVGPIVR